MTVSAAPAKPPTRTMSVRARAEWTWLFRPELRPFINHWLAIECPSTSDPTVSYIQHDGVCRCPAGQYGNPCVHREMVGMAARLFNGEDIGLRYFRYRDGEIVPNPEAPR